MNARRIWLAHDPRRPVGLVLSGGGARGAFQVGVWKVLRDEPGGLGRTPSVISGTSAGAINGALIAAGLSPDEMLEFWLDLAARPPVVANHAFFATALKVVRRLAVREPIRGFGRRSREARRLLELLRSHRLLRSSGWGALLVDLVLTARFDTVSEVLNGIATTSLFDTAPLRERLERAIGGPALATDRVRLAINAVDVHTGEVVRIVNVKPVKHPNSSARHYWYMPVIPVEAIAASAAIPILFNSVELGGRTLWDGGLLVNSPMAPVVALGAKRIIPVLVTSRADPLRPHPFSTLGHAVERAADALLENAYNIDRKLLLDRNALAGRLGDPELSVVDLHRAIRPNSDAPFDAGSYLYFERKALLAMYEAGRRAARRWLLQGPQLQTRATID
ncbi:MAG: patatin-like phospholipase family protein [Deltaproteobacteria bacterium]|jgi:NTE family protein|nr:patatin-like phospholipase family protein [Deltaproteobacteria bacterium]MBW2535725.1 patatin-like phospholipase family protein [Deltaproteobacteria bacterium]